MCAHTHTEIMPKNAMQAYEHESASRLDLVYDNHDIYFTYEKQVQLKPRM